MFDSVPDVNTEPPEDPKEFTCIECFKEYSVEVKHILEENGIDHDGKCHHCLDYDGDLSRELFKECLDNEYL